jgi:hypothetical protein
MAQRRVLFQDREGIQAIVVDRPGRETGSTPELTNGVDTSSQLLINP